MRLGFTKTIPITGGYHGQSTAHLAVISCVTIAIESASELLRMTLHIAGVECVNKTAVFVVLAGLKAV